MDPMHEALSKLASELTDRVDALEKENTILRQQQKQASQPAPVMVAGDSVIQATCDALVKAGAISSEQVSQAKQAFMEDPEAAHRALQGVLDAQAQAKQASQTNMDLSGGVLVSGVATSTTAEDACIDRMSKILNMC